MDDEQMLVFLFPNSHVPLVVIVRIPLSTESTLIHRDGQGNTFKAKNSGLLGLGEANLAKNTLPKVPVPKKSQLITLKQYVFRAHTHCLYESEISHVPPSIVVPITVIISWTLVVKLHPITT